jgi:hypothetical protein
MTSKSTSTTSNNKSPSKRPYNNNNNDDSDSIPTSFSDLQISSSMFSFYCSFPIVVMSFMCECFISSIHDMLCTKRCFHKECIIFVNTVNVVKYRYCRIM